MTEKILITGASGFIGTNLLEDLLSRGYDVCNIDITTPKIENRKNKWKKVNITDYDAFEKAVLNYNPEYLVHLAARTDLDGKTLEDYSVNVVGVDNLMNIINKLPNLKKVIVTSSKFVTKNGYKIRTQFDYCPHTIYGQSKVQTEQIVWNNMPKCDWCIIRPTSIWGPWFGVPYRNFFDMVRRRMFFHIGSIKCHKTYGYIGNAVYQIEQLLFSETRDINNKVFYIGDEPAYEINEWADEIANEYGHKIMTVPVWLIKGLAKFGDLLALFNVHFPMQSFRFENMTNDGVNEMSNTFKIAPQAPFSRLDGTKATIKWLDESKI